MKNRRTVSAETMCGTEVKNQQGENLGKIEDVMIDTHDGDVAYLVLSYGGIFGTTLADKRFAVPYTAITIQNKNSDDDTYYSLNVDKETLENAPGFDKDEYPDFADPQFTSQINRYYASYSEAA